MTPMGRPTPQVRRAGGCPVRLPRAVDGPRDSAYPVGLPVERIALTILESEMSAEVAPDRILQLGLGFWAPKALLSAVELGVFTELAKGPAGLAALTGRLGLHPRSARDFLDALVALGLLERSDDGRYANTPEFDYTGADYSGWLKEAGFRETRVGHLAGPDSMVVGVK